MKKILALIISICMIVSLAACGSSGSSSDSKDDDKKEEATEEATEEEAEEEEPAAEEVAWEVGEAVVNTWVDSIDSRWIQMIVPVTNTGTKNLYLESAKFDLEDETGHLLTTKDLISAAPEVIQPGEVAYYYEETTLDGIDAETIIAVPHVSLEEAKVDCIRLDVSDLDIKGSEYGDIEVTGRVENNTGEDQSSVYIAAFMFDADNKLIARAIDLSFDSLPAGEKVGFSASTFSLPDGVTVDSVANYTVVAYPMQFQF